MILTLFVNDIYYFKVCDNWPEIENGTKVVNSMEMINITYSLTTEYRYNCNMGFTYSKKNNVLNCTSPNTPGDLGKCLRS